MCIYTKSPSEIRGFIMCASKKGKSFSNSILNGEVFFIISENPVHDKLKEIIIHLKGKVEPFFSKDITTLLVEDCHIEEFQFPYHVPNYQLNIRTPNDVSVPGRIVEQVIDKNIPTTSSRGYALLARSTSVHPRNPGDNYVLKVINMANLWGIKVVGIHKFMSWSHTVVKLPVNVPNVKNRVAKPKGIKIPGHFIKIEDIAQKFRPLYRVLPEESVRNFEQLNPNCAVNNCTPDSYLKEHPFHQPHPRQVAKEGAAVHPTNEFGLKADYGGAKAKCNVKNAKLAKPKPKKKPQQYCECCNVNFSNLAQHIKGAKHQAFASNDSNYQCILDIIKYFPSHEEFMEKHERKYMKKVHNDTLNMPSSHSSTSLLAEAPADSSKNMFASHSVPFANSNLNQGMMLNFKHSNAGFLDLHKLALNVNESAKEESQKDMDTSVSLIPQEIHISDIFSQKSGFATGVDLSGQDYEDCWVDVFQECDMNQDSLFAGESFSISNAEPSISQVFKTDGNNSLSFKEFASNEIAQPTNVGASASTSLLNTEATCSTKSSFVVPAGDGSSKHQVDNPANCNQRSPAQKDLTLDFNSELNFINSAFEDSKLGSFSFNNLNSHMPDVYFEKSDQINPCSSFLPVRAEHMFTSSSSDDERDGKSLISNVLSFINKSASEVELGNDKSRSSHESKLKSPVFKKNAGDKSANAVNKNADVTESAEWKSKIPFDRLKSPAAITSECSKQPVIVSKSGGTAKDVKDVKVCDLLQKTLLRDELKSSGVGKPSETVGYDNQNILRANEFKLSNSKICGGVIKNQFLDKLITTETEKRSPEIEIQNNQSKKSVGESKRTAVGKLSNEAGMCNIVDKVSHVTEYLDYSIKCNKVSAISSLTNNELKPLNMKKVVVGKPKVNQNIGKMVLDVKPKVDLNIEKAVAVKPKVNHSIEKIVADIKPNISQNNLCVREFKILGDYHQKCDNVKASAFSSHAEDTNFAPKGANSELKTKSNNEKRLNEVKVHRNDQESISGCGVGLPSKIKACSEVVDLSLSSGTKFSDTKIHSSQVKASSIHNLPVVETKSLCKINADSKITSSSDCPKQVNIVSNNNQIKIFDNQNAIDIRKLESYKSKTHNAVGRALCSNVEAGSVQKPVHVAQGSVLNEIECSSKSVNSVCVPSRSVSANSGGNSQSEMCNSHDTMISATEAKCEDLNKSERMEISSVDEGMYHELGYSKACCEMDITSGTSGVILPHYSDVSSEVSSSSGEYFLHTYGLPKPSSLWTVQSVSEDKMRLKFSRVRDTCGNCLIKPDNHLSECVECSDAMDTTGS